MAQQWRVKTGSKVRYRNGAGRVFHAIVTAVTNQTTVDLRVGNGATKSTVTSAVRDNDRVGAGWYRSGNEFPTEPLAPLAGVAVAGNTDAQFTWPVTRHDGRSPVTGYTVTPYIGAAAQTPQVFDATLTTRTITGLTNDVEYTFTVFATNAVGDSAESPKSNAVTPVEPPP